MVVEVVARDAILQTPGRHPGVGVFAYCSAQLIFPAARMPRQSRRLWAGRESTPTAERPREHTAHSTFGFLDLLGDFGQTLGPQRRHHELAHFTSAEVAQLESVAEELERKRPAAARLLRRLLRAVRQPRRPDKGDDDMLTTTEAARLLGVSDQTVRNWADLQWISAYRLHPLARRQIPAAALRRVLEFRRKAEALIPEARRLSDEEAIALVAKRRARKRTHSSLVGRSR